MKEYLKLFSNGFDETVPSRRAIENWPFVGHDVVSGEVVYTEIPKPVTGPADNEIWYTSSDGNVVNPDETDTFNANIVSNIYEDGKGVIKFDNSVTGIGNHAFRYCRSLISMVISDSVTRIGSGTFEGCSSLADIVIPNSVTNIDKRAFSECESLTSIVIPDGVTSIGEGAFYYCSSLTSVTIPNNVTSIGVGAFGGCKSLVSMVVESGNAKYDSRDNCNAIIETATNTLISGCQNTTIPNSVTSIGDYAFCECSSLTSVTIPNSVTSIGGGAFSTCSSLTSITIPDSVTSIGDYTFAYCRSITSITFEGTIEEWNNIDKDSSWNLNVPATYVQCSDGQVTL